MSTTSTWVATDGIRYLRPEITLHFKARLCSGRRTTATSRVVLPLLTDDRRAWLREAIETTEGPDHPWLAAI